MIRISMKIGMRSMVSELSMVHEYWRILPGKVVAVVAMAVVTLLPQVLAIGLTFRVIRMDLG